MPTDVASHYTGQGALAAGIADGLERPAKAGPFRHNRVNALPCRLLEDAGDEGAAMAAFAGSLATRIREKRLEDEQ